MVIECSHLVEGKLNKLDEKYVIPHTKEEFPKLECKKYGFDCNFIATSEDIGKIIREFREHTLQEHHIDYPEGVLMKFIRNKKR